MNCTLSLKFVEFTHKNDIRNPIERIAMTKLK